MKIKIDPAEISFAPRKASSALRQLRPVFEKLVSVQQRYCDAVDDDCSIWHGERTQTGWLSTAVWECGGVAKEEYSAPRRGGKLKNGRCDISLWTPNTRATEFCCEAKYISLNLGRGSKALASSICERLRKALKQVRCLSDLEAQAVHARGLALCFVTAMIKADKLDQTGNLLENVKDAILGRAHCHCLVWLEAQKPLIDKKNWAYPGLLIAIAER